MGQFSMGRAGLAQDLNQPDCKKRETRGFLNEKVERYDAAFEASSLFRSQKRQKFTTLPPKHVPSNLSRSSLQ
jgi:hypothetical protein